MAYFAFICLRYLPYKFEIFDPQISCNWPCWPIRLGCHPIVRYKNNIDLSSCAARTAIQVLQTARVPR